MGDPNVPRKKQQFKCPKCGQSFKMAMHLGRHMTTIHGHSPKRSASAAGPKTTTNGDPARVLVEIVNDLRARRQEHVDGLARIDDLFAKCGIQLQQQKRRGRPPGRRTGTPVAAAAPAKRRKRRTRRKFAVSGLDSILGFVKGAGKKGATTSEIVKHWKSEGRSGDGYTALGQLVKERKLSKEKLKEAKGSRYKAA
jgi:hypothetical protein